MARLGTLLTYRTAERELEHLLGIHLSNTAIKKCTECVGEKALKVEPEQLKFSKKEHISIQIDGGRVRTIEEDWKEVKVGIVAGSKKKLQMSRITDHNTFMDEFCGVIREHGYHTHLPSRNLVSDGAPWIGEDFRQRFPKMPQVLDYYHFKEHLHDTAKEVFPSDEVKADFWVEKIKGFAYENKSEEILSMINLEWQIQDEKNRIAKESLRKLLQYLKDNKEKIRYGKFKELGYEIGSGKVEATIKTLLEYRMKSASKRWRLQNARKLLTLRDIYFNDAWNMLSSIR